MALLWGLAFPVGGNADTPAKGSDWKAAKEAFLLAVSKQDDAAILQALVQVARFDNLEVAEILLRHGLPNEDITVNREVFRILTQLKDEVARKVMIDACAKEKTWELRSAAIRVVASYGGDFVLSKLEPALSDKKWQVRAAAVRAMAHMRLKRAIPLLIERLKAERGRLLWDLRWALQHLTGERMEPVHQEWFVWWTTNEPSFVVPSKAEVEKKLGARDDERKDLRTAVQEGIYGPIYGERIAFLLDVSGSMSVGADNTETRIEIAKRELVKVLENQLSPQTYFTIIVFSEDVLANQKGLQKASEKSIAKAVEFVGRLKAGGETNAHGALRLAFDDKEIDTIYLLSDGSPTVGEQTIPEMIYLQVGEWNRHRHVIINCIGFFPGNAKNENKQEARDFLRKLALENEGYYREIY